MSSRLEQAVSQGPAGIAESDQEFRVAVIATRNANQKAGLPLRAEGIRIKLNSLQTESPWLGYSAGVIVHLRSRALRRHLIGIRIN